MLNSKKYFLFFLLIGFGSLVFGQSGWPKVIPFKNGGSATVYQPQPDNFEGNKIEGRSAVAVRETKTSEPVFGVIFFDAKMDVDKNSRTAVLESIVITASKFTGVDDTAKLNKLSRFLEAEIPKWNLEISIDALVATIKKEHPNAEIYNNDPPEIIYAIRPSTLIMLNGDPYIKMDKKMDAERVLNTPSLIFKEGSQWNLYNGGVWYKSASVLNGWAEQRNLSAKVKSINDQIKKQEKENNDGKEVTAKPEVTEIIVRTKAAELIQSKGTPEYKDIAGTSLSFISNSPNNIFKDKNTGSIYILIAGRWFKSSSLNGSWTFNEPDKLPADFSKIPEGSDKDEVLSSVAGTDAAEEAMIDAEIPQTAKVDRKTATVKVEYDGAPIFKKIDGTSLELAENASVTVMKEAGGSYFALDNGVWFISSSATGSWSVATRRPKDVENIPMQNKAYNTKFVHIYEVTDSYTIQGYTAGYLGSYIQGDPVIVFGTGFYYAPWYGSMYYPGPCTWGFGFCYNPWFGWSMNYGFNIGFIHFGFGFGWGGWFGPPMYHPPYRPPYLGGGYYGRPRPGGNVNMGNNINININSNNNNIYRPNRPGNNGGSNRPGIVTKPGNNRPGTINRRPGSNYGTGNQRPGLGNGNNNLPNRPGAGNNGPLQNRPNARPANGTNNVFSDKQGNIFQTDRNNNIRQRDNRNNSWQPTQNNEIRRDIQSRDRGNQRTNNFNQMQNRTPASRPAMGGGGAGGARPSLRRN
jgi:hypothetical protein